MLDGSRSARNVAAARSASRAPRSGTSTVTASVYSCVFAAAYRHTGWKPPGWARILRANGSRYRHRWRLAVTDPITPRQFEEAGVEGWRVFSHGVYAYYPSASVRESVRLAEAIADLPSVADRCVPTVRGASTSSCGYRGTRPSRASRQVSPQAAGSSATTSKRPSGRSPIPPATRSISRRRRHPIQPTKSRTTSARAGSGLGETAGLPLVQ